MNVPQLLHYRMSSDLIASLHLDRTITSKVIVAKELNGCESAFITSCILVHCLKHKQAIILITTHNSLLHYQNVGLKMNYNLQRHIDSGLVHFFKLDEELVSLVMRKEHKSLEQVISTLKHIIKSMRAGNSIVNIIFDGVSHLFDLQYSLGEVNKFCSEIIKLVRDGANSFVLFHCNVASEDDVTHTMTNLLAHASDTIIEVGSLSSGWSADVSGHLTIKHPGCKFIDEHMNTINMKSSRFLFKLFDRGVKLFAPGTV